MLRRKWNGARITSTWKMISEIELRTDKAWEYRETPSSRASARSHIPHPPPPQPHPSPSKTLLKFRLFMMMTRNIYYTSENATQFIQHKLGVKWYLISSVVVFFCLLKALCSVYVSGETILSKEFYLRRRWGWRWWWPWWVARQRKLLWIFKGVFRMRNAYGRSFRSPFLLIHRHHQYSPVMGQKIRTTRECVTVVVIIVLMFWGEKKEGPSSKPFSLLMWFFNCYLTRN